MQVVDQLRNKILPQAKDLLDRAKRDGGTTIPTSFEQVQQQHCLQGHTANIHLTMMLCVRNLSNSCCKHTWTSQHTSDLQVS